MKNLSVFWLCLVALALAPAALAERYRDRSNGFSVEVPKFPELTAPASQAVIFYAPARDGFSANCNVQIQMVESSLEGYVELTEQQFKSAGVELVSSKSIKLSGSKAWHWHYRGPFNARDFDWLAVVTKHKGKFYLMTCTALEKHAELTRKVFTETLASFKVH